VADADGKQSFWTTIPGILTGFAAVLTASTGFYLAMQHSRPTADAPKPAIVSDAPNTAPTSSQPSPQPQAPSASPSAPAVASAATNAGMVTVLSRAGDTTQVTIKSFKHNLYDNAIQLVSGQTIPFEKIRAIDFAEVDTDGRSVAITTTLVDGRSIPGGLFINYAFQGQNDLGPFSIPVQNVKQIVFAR
jgi:hypothetical protein